MLSGAHPNKIVYALIGLPVKVLELDPMEASCWVPAIIQNRRNNVIHILKELLKTSTIAFVSISTTGNEMFKLQHSIRPSLNPQSLAAKVLVIPMLLMKQLPIGHFHLSQHPHNSPSLNYQQKIHLCSASSTPPAAFPTWFSWCFYRKEVLEMKHSEYTPLLDSESQMPTWGLCSSF